MSKKYNYPKGYSLIQTTLKARDFLNHPINFINESMEKFGSTYSATVGSDKLILTKDPNFINYILRENHKVYTRSNISAKRGAQFFGKGLLFSTGEYWLRQRRMIQPAFHRNKIKGLYKNIKNIIENYLDNIPTGSNVDIVPIMHDLSFQVLIKSLFDIELSKETISELNEIFEDLSNFLIKDVNVPLRRLFYPITGEERNHLRKAKRLREIVKMIINDRKSRKEEFADILDMLIHSSYEDTGEKMTEEQLIDEVQILILAGHETTGNTLSWLLYNLASNHMAQEKIIASIKEVTVDEVFENSYLRACINESMRLFSTSWTSERVSMMDDKFKDYSYPKGTIIIPYFFGLHRDKHLWEDALLFKPERFIEDKKLSKSKKYFPFGAGPRMCIGNSFALAEISYFLVSFFKLFTIEKVMPEPKLKPLLTLRPDKVIVKINRHN